jgi:hypothetical protein
LSGTKHWPIEDYGRPTSIHEENFAYPIVKPKSYHIPGAQSDIQHSRGSYVLDKGFILAVVVASCFLVYSIDHRHGKQSSEAPPAVDVGSEELGFDFAFQVFSKNCDQSGTRLVKIQCPGVAHEDVEVQVIFNGCDVVIRRKASQGVRAVTWRRRFAFRPSEGLFEFAADQMQLERGFLHLVFKDNAFQKRVVRFPQHFSLDSTDNDLRWECEEDEEKPFDRHSLPN